VNVDSSSEPTAPDPADAFETWLLRRVAEAVEGAEVSADLLTELQAEIADARARPPDTRDTLALMELAERVSLPVDHLTELLATPVARRSRTDAMTRLLRQGLP
jgi:hypothetical protein